MAFELPPAVYSPELLESVQYEIQQYLAWYRQTRVQKQVGAASAEEPTHSAETTLTIEAWLGGKKATLEALEELLAHLRGLNLPVVHITLAALPNHAQRVQLVDWFHAATPGHRVLLAFVADRNLGGGVVVRTPNHLYDYSWKQQLIAGRAKVAEIISRA
jgi:hypothetical protein